MIRKSRRKSKRHEIDSSRQIAVKVRRTINGNEAAEAIEAQIVDISLNGFKLHATTAFEFQEKIVVELPRQEGEPIEATAEVRWVEPSDHHTWFIGCLNSEAFPAHYLDELAQVGVLNRRNSVRHDTVRKAVGRWELSQEEVPVTIVNVSANGVAIRVDQEVEIGKRIRIQLDDSTTITARAVWQTPVDGGFHVGCEATEGSPFAVIESSLSGALHQAQETASHYQVLSLCGLSLFLVMLIREWFF